MLIDTSRNGWGGPDRPTAARARPADRDTRSCNATKIDQRPFRGDWCNRERRGHRARSRRPTRTRRSTHLYAYVWIKPPGESDGDYPTATHAHGDPHCDPNGTNTDGNGNTYPTDAIPGYDVPAGQWFPAEFTAAGHRTLYPAVP